MVLKCLFGCGIMAGCALMVSIASAGIIKPVSVDTTITGDAGSSHLWLIDDNPTYATEAPLQRPVGTTVTLNSGDPLTDALATFHARNTSAHAESWTRQTTQGNPVFTFDLTGGGDTGVGSILLWQYGNTGGGTLSGNLTREFSVDWRTEAEGTGGAFATDFANVMDPVSGTTETNVAQYFPFGSAQNARYALLRIDSNYDGQPGETGGGDRYGLGEVRFATEHQIFGPSFLQLTVDTTSGAVSIDHVVNDLPLGFDIDYYEIASSDSNMSGQGSLVPGNWNRLQDQGFDASGAPEGDYNQDGTTDAADYTVWRDSLGQAVSLLNNSPSATTPNLVDQEEYDFWKANFGSTGGSGGPAWVEAGNVSDTIVGETYLTGSSLLENGISLSLGNLFRVGDAEDLTFTYHVVGDAGFRTGVIQYIPGGAGGVSAVPEPGSLIIVALACLMLAIGHRRGSRVPTATIAVCVVSCAAAYHTPATFAAGFLDRDYKFGESPFGENGMAGNNISSVTYDDAGSFSDGTAQDAFPIPANGPVYEDVSTRPLAGSGTQLGIRLNGTNMEYLRALRFGNPSTSASAIAAVPVDLSGIQDRGLQLWVNPDDALLGNGIVQSVVRDTNQHGVLISGTGTWLMDYSNTLFDTGVAVKTDAVDGGWHHVQHVRPSGAAGGARMYVDGIAVGFVAGNYTTTDDADLVIGSNTGGTALDFTGGTAEFFSGVVDNLTMHAYGTTTQGSVLGQFNLAVDNEFVASALQGQMIGDLTGDNVVAGDGLSGSGEPDADDDVLAFIENWRFTKMINGRAVGDLVTFDKGDFNFDGIVSWPDWHVLRTAHSGGAGAISSAAFARLAGVPEPTSAALAFCAAFAGCGLRRAWRNVPR